MVSQFIIDTESSGLVAEVANEDAISRIYAMNPGERLELSEDATHFLYCQGVRCEVRQPGRPTMVVEKDCYASIPGMCEVSCLGHGRAVITSRMGWIGLRMVGGPIEERGRLRYIDSCSDTLLCGPPMLGDACLNHLHFPPNIEQTFHHHPSVRSGIVARGNGWCETPDGRMELTTGAVFHLPTGQTHRFVTADESMDVIAYHPDSDFGPEDEIHPMINRTWDEVSGQKINNNQGNHTKAEVIDGYCGGSVVVRAMDA